MASNNVSPLQQAEATYRGAGDFYAGVKARLDALTANGGADALSSQYGEYQAVKDQLAEAGRRFTQAEKAYQDALVAQDRANAQRPLAAGTTRKTLVAAADGSRVAVTEVADGQGSWSLDTTRPPEPFLPAGRTTSDLPPPPVTTTAQKIPTRTPEGAWAWVDNPNYVPPKPDPAERPPVPSVNTQAPQIPEWTGSAWAWKPNPNYQPPEAKLTPGEQATDAATAGTAADLAATALRKAQADADTALQGLENARRLARQAPTDQQAQAAIQTAQRGLDLANQQLEQALARSSSLDPVTVEQARATLAATRATTARAEALQPGEVAQQSANLEATRAATDKARLGDLYGVRAKIAEVKDLIASGKLDPKQADQAINDFVNAQLNGVSLYDATRAAADANMQKDAQRLQQRQQDMALTTNKMQTFGSLANNALSTFADMNKTAAIGSGAGADAFFAAQRMASNALDQYRPSAPLPIEDVPTYLRNLYSGGMAGALPAALPAPTAGVTINIGGAAPAPPAVPPVALPPSPVAGPSGGSRWAGAPAATGPLPAYAAGQQPATEADFEAIWGRKPGAARAPTQIDASGSPAPRGPLSG